MEWEAEGDSQLLEYLNKLLENIGAIENLSNYFQDQVPLCSIVSWLSQCWLPLLSGSGLTGNTPVCHFASVSFVSIGHWRDLDTFY